HPDLLAQRLLAHRLAHFFEKNHRPLFIRFGKQDSEFIAPQTRRGVRAACVLDEEVADGAEKFIPCRMTKSVIGGFEVVEVHKGNGQRTRMPALAVGFKLYT